MGANRGYDSNAEPTAPPGIKSDRLLVDDLIEIYIEPKSSGPRITCRVSSPEIEIIISPIVSLKEFQYLQCSIMIAETD
jgi:hypothetical protein